MYHPCQYLGHSTAWQTDGDLAFILILQIFFPGELSIHKAFYVLSVIISLYPLLRLHLNQCRQLHQPTQTAWTKSIVGILRSAFELEDNYPPIWASGQDSGDECSARISDDLAGLFMMLGFNSYNLAEPSPDSLFTAPRVVLCIFCPPGDLNIVPTLWRHVEPKIVWVLDERLHWVEADLVIAHCASCRADYFPDRITYKDNAGAHPFLRVLKHGIWVQKQIALLQENTIHRFHAGWSNFAEWANDSTHAKQKFTYRQSQRFFTKHFSRRLLLFPNRHNFSCEAHPSTHRLANAVCAVIGANGGVLDKAMTHGCKRCTHLKSYHSDLIVEGVVLGDNPAVTLTLPPQQEALLPGQPRGYVRMAVMDGKVIPHQREGPLVNYKDGRFCEAHLNLHGVCSIIPCGLAVRHTGALTRATPAHIQWERQYTARFSRLTFPGLRRLADDAARRPTLHVSLPPSKNCLQTGQLTCGYPIGWGECYRSESTLQVLAILNQIWEAHPNSKPSFIAYDDACDLLRHIITQNPHNPWIISQ
ncbi:hypothetical protein K438DRAFT_1907357 [Mycena galopus ATCC 62051]|nr:hypothetical protein K438DRAFT_1907357 [Mycena galopus ATCC 62051]